MIRASEGSLAELASVRPDPCVFPHMSSKFVRSGELPATARPGADIRLLPSVGPQMGLHVGGFVVSLVAVVVGTVVDLRNLPASSHFPHLHWQLESGGGGNQLVVVIARGGGGGGGGGEDYRGVVVVVVGLIGGRRGSQGTAAAVVWTGRKAVVILREDVLLLVYVGTVDIRVRVAISCIVLGAVLGIVPTEVPAVVVVLCAVVARVELFLLRPHLAQCLHHLSLPTDGC